MTKSIKLTNFWETKLTGDEFYEIDSQAISKYSLNLSPFIDSFRVEINSNDVRGLEELAKDGIAQLPSKDFVQKVLQSNKIKIDANIKCLPHYAFNISIRNESDVELSAIDSSQINAINKAMDLFKNRNLQMRNLDVAQDFNFAMNIPASKYNHLKALLRDAF